MKRLGIAIKSTLMGSGEPIKVNAGPWDSKVVDIRDVLRHVPSLAADPNRSIIFFSFSETGCYITVARCIPNRPGDNIAGWIYLPNDVRISGDEVCRIVDEVRNIIFLSELPDRKKLEETFSTEYPEKGACKYKPSAKNGKFAKREVTPTTPLNTLLGAGLYQPVYTSYQGVFVEQFSNEVVDALDLTAQPLAYYITLLPPSADELAQLGPGTQISIAKTGEAFTKPILVNRGARIDFKIMRRGFKPEVFPVRVENDGMHLAIPQINWQPIAAGPAPAMGMEQPPVILGAGPSQPTDDLPTWSVELNNGYRGQVMVRGNNVSRHSSPLRGYEAEGSLLVFKGGDEWKQRIIGFAAAICLGLVVCGILALAGAFGSDKKEQTAEAEDPIEQMEITGKDHEAAIAYLEKNNVWKKSEMDNIKELQGLFDALNEYNYALIESRNQRLGSESAKMRTIFEKVSQGRANNSLPSAPFTSGNQITYTDYIGKLNIQNQAPVSTPSVSSESSYSGGGNFNPSNINPRRDNGGNVKKPQTQKPNQSVAKPNPAPKPNTAPKPNQNSNTKPKPSTPKPERGNIE